jgi:O-antigen/teichoic acid export membrane protein
VPLDWRSARANTYRRTAGWPRWWVIGGPPPGLVLGAPPEPAQAAGQPVEVRRGVGRDVLLTFGGRLALTAALIVGDVILARGLGPEGKGAFVLVLNLTSLGALVLSLGLDRSLAVFAARSLATARTGFANVALWTLVVGGLGVLAIIALYGPRTADHAPTGLLAPLLPALTAPQLWFGALALPGELAFGIGLVGLLGRQRVLAYNVIRFLRRGVFVLLLVGFVALGRLDLELALVLNLVALAVTVVAIVWAMLRAQMVGLRPDPGLLVEQLSFGGRTVMGTLAERLHFRANTFLLNAFIGVGATGVFSVALGLAEILWYLPTSFGLVLFSRAVRGSRETANIASAMTRVVLAGMIVGAVPLWLLAPTLVELVYGAPFRDAGAALQLMLPGVVAYSIVAVLTHPLIAWGAPGRVTAVLAAGLLVNLGANLLLIPQLGMNGAALASSVSYISTALLILLLYRRVSGHGLGQALLIRRSDVSRIGHEIRMRFA